MYIGVRDVSIMAQSACHHNMNLFATVKKLHTAVVMYYCGHCLNVFKCVSHIRFAVRTMCMV